MDEFTLIRHILSELAVDDAPAWLSLGPGDDACVAQPPAGHELASSIDGFLAGVHFPAAAAPELIGYRCMMASLSDLAAMAATPAWVLVALNLPAESPLPPTQKDEEPTRSANAVASLGPMWEGVGEPTPAPTGWALMEAQSARRHSVLGEPTPALTEWVLGLCRGLAMAVREAGARIAGGNLAAGPAALTLSVHGWAPAGSMLRRSGARPGHAVCVTGPLGGAARALASLDLARSVPGQLNPLERCYWRPQPPFHLATELRRHAGSGIDISDGLLQDLGHLCTASGVGVHLRSSAIPLAQGARLEDALAGSDDYVLAFTTAHMPLRERFPVIGEVAAPPGLRLDGKPVAAQGFRHF